MLSLVCFIPACETILSTKSSDRLLGLICSIMFLAGVALACQEAVRWWRARLERFQSPPLPRLITYELDSGRRWRPTQLLWFRLPETHAIPKR